MSMVGSGSIGDMETLPLVIELKLFTNVSMLRKPMLQRSSSIVNCTVAGIVDEMESTDLKGGPLYVDGLSLVILDGGKVVDGDRMPRKLSTAFVGLICCRNFSFTVTQWLL